MVVVARVEPQSVAEELGIVAGTRFLSVNGRAIEDFLDWEFLTADDWIAVEAQAPDGQQVVYEIERGDGESLGVRLEPPRVRRCANKCEFCFIEGLPPGLRKNLYVRDDDYRLSFTYGNFATLSNLRQRDIARILEYRLSPLYVSVHATNLEVRQKLLNNPRVPDVKDQLATLAAGGIRFHCQMVIVPGLNDAAVLDESLRDLWDLGEAVISTAVVPVGLTQFSHLYTGTPMNRTTASRILTQVLEWSARAAKERGEPWVFASDEMYLLAGKPLPDARHYGEFPQIENGVGAVASLRQRVREGLSRLPPLRGERIGVVTGTAMGSLLPDLLSAIATRTGAEFELVKVTNTLFGPAITTAGLLTGADIRAALQSRSHLSMWLIPAETLNEDGIFLDDLSFGELQGSVSVPVHASYDFLDVLGSQPVATAA